MIPFLAGFFVTAIFTIVWYLAITRPVWCAECGLLKKRCICSNIECSAHPYKSDAEPRQPRQMPGPASEQVFDYVPCSLEAFLDLIRQPAVDTEAFYILLVKRIEDLGCTSNQAKLISDVHYDLHRSKYSKER